MPNLPSGKEFFNWLAEKRRFELLQKHIPIKEYISGILTPLAMKRFTLPQKMGEDKFITIEITLDDKELFTTKVKQIHKIRVILN